MFKTPEPHRVTEGEYGTSRSHGNNGFFLVPLGEGREPALCNASDDGIHERLIVSTLQKTLTVDDLERIKALFWSDDDTVAQIYSSECRELSPYPGAVLLFRRRGIDFDFPLTLLMRGLA